MTGFAATLSTTRDDSTHHHVVGFLVFDNPALALILRID